MSNGLNVIPLFDTATLPRQEPVKETKEELKRLDLDGALRKRILPLCRLKYGEIWEDPISGHRVGVLDASLAQDIDRIMSGEKTTLAVNDPPYNVAVGNVNTKNLFKTGLKEYLEFSRQWISNTVFVLSPNAHFYLWMGADYKSET